MDFIKIGIKENKDGTREFFPQFLVMGSQDLVIRGGQLFALWDETTQLYSRETFRAADIIDHAFAKMVGERVRTGDIIRKMRVFDNQLFTKFLSLVRSIGDMGPDLDQKIIFADQTPTKVDAATFKMSYSLSPTPPVAWESLLEPLYDANERLKIEWAIGSIFTGDAAHLIQKMYVFFGPPGSGKSTVMNIIEMLFEGHTASFSAYEMGRADAQFALEPFARNPLVAIDQDGDMSRIEANKHLNSIVAHDKVVINVKGKNLFTIKPRTTLFVGTNEAVKISDRKSGLLRRLVDIRPTGATIDEDSYYDLIGRIHFELGSIAARCIRVYQHYGPAYLSSYRATDMMYRTNDLFNFVEDNRMVLSHGVTLKQAHKMYLAWCEETDTKAVYKQYKFRDLLKDYYEEFHEQIMVDGAKYRSYFRNLKPLEEFTWLDIKAERTSWLQLESQASLLDDVLAEQAAQYYSGHAEHPLTHSWSRCTTKLRDLETSQEHFVTVPTQHIVIDFDLKNTTGEKDLHLNLKAASGWPPTYAEVSRGGQGLHLHYNYVGDVDQLASSGGGGAYEIKTLLGNASLRRKVSRCNAIPIATLSGGLPLKEEKKVISSNTLMTDKGMRELLVKALTKQIHAHTKPSMDFIKKVLEDAQAQGMVYDVTDMYDDILEFAMSSSNQRDYCLKVFNELKLKSETEFDSEPPTTDILVYFDCEVFPNLFVVCWMYDDDDATVVKMINPTPHEVEQLFSYGLIGFNNRMFDNHILYARSMGYSNEELYRLSQEIIVKGNRDALFGAAYNLHYADVYDYASEKKSLKKWQVELGLPHLEIDLPWDEPVPDHRVLDVAEYCASDVRATRAVAKARVGDFVARQILSELSGLEVANTTRQHTEKLIFGDVKDTQPYLVYTDLSQRFPGYKFDKFAKAKEKSTYKGEMVGEGGYVYAVPGMYESVALLDVASMHPTSIIELNAFGPYTQVFKDLLDTRLLIKHGQLNEAAKMFGGRIAPFVTNQEQAKQLEWALKIVINTVYGLTAATFPNRFRDEDNIDNIVAKRGALFMIDLKEFIQSKGFKVVHIKTDSVKIPGATPELIKMIMEFGEEYGYTFEHEATYEKFCLVNDAVYVACKDGVWSATGAQFQHPVVFKAIFDTTERIDWDDYIELKQVSKGAMYLVDPNDGSKQFVGRFGAFVPILNGRNLMRLDGEKLHAVVGTKGYLWELADVAKSQNYDIDLTYFDKLVQEAWATLKQFGLLL